MSYEFGNATLDAFNADLQLAIKMEDANLLDVSQNTNNGTNIGTSDIVGASGRAREWDGSTNNMSVPADASIANLFDGGGTVACWVYPKSDGENSEGRIYTKDPWCFLDVDSESVGKVKIKLTRYFSTTHGQWQSTSTELDLNTWSLVVVTYDSSNVANNPIIYINGTSVALTETSTPVGTRTTEAAGNLYIGNHSVSTIRTWDGGIDEFYMWDAILSLEAVVALWNTGDGLFYHEITGPVISSAKSPNIWIA